MLQPVFFSAAGSRVVQPGCALTPRLTLTDAAQALLQRCRRLLHGAPRAPEMRAHAHTPHRNRTAKATPQRRLPTVHSATVVVTLLCRRSNCAKKFRPQRPHTSAAEHGRQKNTSAHPTKGIDRCPATAGSCSCGMNPIRYPCRQTSDIPSLKRTALQHGSRTKHTAGPQNVRRRRPTPLYSKKGRPGGITIRGPLQSSAMCYELQQTLVQSKRIQAPCGTHTPTGTDAHTEASRGNSATQQQLQITRRLACRSQLRMTARCGKRIHTCHRLHQQHLKSAR